MTAAIVVQETGGPGKLRFREIELPAVKADEVRVRHHAGGLNFIDVYYRKGVYKAPVMPFTPGQEASGIVEEVGPEVIDFRIGDRVAYATQPLGAYFPPTSLSSFPTPLIIPWRRLCCSRA
jgi:NADPH2:quinone reductase